MSVMSVRDTKYYYSKANQIGLHYWHNLLTILFILRRTALCIVLKVPMKQTSTNKLRDDQIVSCVSNEKACSEITTCFKIKPEKLKCFQ